MSLHITATVTCDERGCNEQWMLPIADSSMGLSDIDGAPFTKVYFDIDETEKQFCVKHSGGEVDQEVVERALTYESWTAPALERWEIEQRIEATR